MSTLPYRRSAPRILIVKPCCLGDVVMATPALRALRCHWPAAVIEMAVAPWAAPAVEGNPHLDRIWQLDYPLRLQPLLQSARRLRRRRYDIGIGLDRSPLVNGLLWLSGAPVRVGVASGWRGLGLTIKVRPARLEHETHLALRVLAALGVPSQGDAPEYSPQPALVAAMRQRFGGLGRPLVVVHPGGGVNPGAQRLDKRWPPERFAALLDALRERFAGLAAVLVGDEADREAAAHVAALTSFPVQQVSGQLTLAETAALCAIADLVVGNDSGVGHLAAAAGTPTVTIFGPTDPRRYRPLGPQSRFCAPPGAERYWRDRDLRKRERVHPALDIRCVAVEAVVAACDELLRTRAWTAPV